MASEIDCGGLSCATGQCLLILRYPYCLGLRFFFSFGFYRPVNYSGMGDFL
jgi:hypothetical protein